jgi:hypothetical protein
MAGRRPSPDLPTDELLAGASVVEDFHFGFGKRLCLAFVSPPKRLGVEAGDFDSVFNEAEVQLTV